MLGWFKALMPKEERFFALFAKHAAIVVAGAEALCGALKGGDEVERYCRIVSERENEAAKTIMLFEVSSFEPQMQQMGDIILQASKLILEAMPLLASIPRDAGRLTALTEEVIRIEEQADQLHDQGRKTLLLASKNTQGSVMEYLTGTELYDHLESVVDRLEDVSNEI